MVHDASMFRSVCHVSCRVNPNSHRTLEDANPQGGVGASVPQGLCYGNFEASATTGQQLED